MSAPLNGKVGLIAKIHIAKKQLALTDESYRDILLRVTGKQSCSVMGIVELENVITEFKRLGFKWNKNPKRAGNRKMAQTDQAKMIRGMWIELHEKGEVKDPSEDAIAAYVKRMADVDDLHWLTPADANKVINGLRNWISRAEKKTHA